jgi:DNA-binding NarL/FixJ family response regulator
LRTILGSKIGWEVCAEARTGEEAIQMARRFRPDVVILDVDVPGKTSLEVCAIIKGGFPGVEVIVLTGDYSLSLLQAVVRSGALGLVLNSDAYRDLVAAIESVRRREAYISRHVDAIFPASSRTTPLLMLLADNEVLTLQERAQVRTIASQMGHSL